MIIWNSHSNYLAILEKSSPLYGFYKKDKYSQINELLNQEDQRDIQPEMLKQIIEHTLKGFLTKDSAQQELSKAATDNLNKRTDKETLTIIFTTTLGCNFGCSYCCQGTEKDFTLGSSSIVESISSLYLKNNYKNLSLTWYGGEPLLAKSLVVDGSTFLKNLVEENGGKYKGTLVTNGSLLDIKTAALIYNAGIKSIHFSLDGCKIYHDTSRKLKSQSNSISTYDVIMKNIAAIEKSELNIKNTVRINHLPSVNSINQTVDDLISYNADKWTKTKFYLAKIDKRLASTVDLTCDSSNLLFASDFQIFCKLSSKYSIPISYPRFSHGLCAATIKDGFVLSPTGGIHKCTDTVSIESESISSIASSNENIIGSIADNKWTDFSATDNEYCRACKLMPACGGNCSMKHFNDLKYYDNYHSACPPMKFIVSNIIQDYAHKLELIQNDNTGDFSDVNVSELRIKN
jgi:uncharacterized protein